MTIATTHLIAAGAVPQQVRVSLRELRECAFRSLVANGASAGEAAVAAEQVLHAELYDGVGLRHLLDDLAQGWWTTAGLRASTESVDGCTLVVVDGDRSGPLRQGALLGDLATAVSPGTPVLVASGGIRTASAVLDDVLVRAARWSGAVAVVEVGQDGTLGAARVATVEGAVGPAAAQSAVPAALRQRLPRGGVALLRTNQLPAPTEAGRSAAALRARRRQAAADGLHVCADVWQATHAAAQRYLVPES